MKPITVRDLRDELKIAFRENNKFIFKQVKIDTKNSIKSAIETNNKILVKQIDNVVNDRLTEFSDIILETIDVNHNEANEKFDTIGKDVNRLSNDMEDVKRDIKFICQDISDIETGISLKPSRKQFEEFKSKFDNYPTV